MNNKLLSLFIVLSLSAVMAKDTEDDQRSPDTAPPASGPASIDSQGASGSDSQGSSDVEGIHALLTSEDSSNLIGSSSTPATQETAQLGFTGNSFFEAVDAGNIDLLRVLIEAELNPNVIDDVDWRTPVMRAIVLGDLAAIQVLVDGGARLEGGDRHGNTTWSLAEQGGNPHIISYIRSHLELQRSQHVPR